MSTFERTARVVHRAPHASLLAAGCALSSLVIGGLIVGGGRGARLAVALAVAPLLFVLLVRSQHRLVLATVLIIAVPWWKTFGSSQMKVGIIAPVLALTGYAGVAAARKGAARRLTFTDVAFATLLSAAILNWIYNGPHTHHSVTSFLLYALPGLFYVAVRGAAGPTRRLICWVVFITGTVAALQLYLEFFVLKRPLFPNGIYQWSQGFFRPGGSFGDPPAAVAALAMTSLIGISLLVTSPASRRTVVSVCLAVSIGGMIITFTRSGLIGFALGVVVFVALWNPRRLGSFAFWTAVVGSVFALFILPSLTGKDWYQKGVTRGGTLANRQGRWAVAWPLVTNSSTHLVFGHGINALSFGHLGGLAGTPQADIAAVPVLATGSPHSQYIRTLIEQGLIGLAILGAWLLTPLWTVLRTVGRTRHRDDRALLAGCAAGIVSFLVVAALNDSLREPSNFALVALLIGLVTACSGGLQKSTDAREAS